MLEDVGTPEEIIDAVKEAVLQLWREVLQLCAHPVVGWQDAPPGIFGLWSIQVAAI
jgi:hypothetical protein